MFEFRVREVAGEDHALLPYDPLRGLAVLRFGLPFAAVGFGGCGSSSQHSSLSQYCGILIHLGSLAAFASAYWAAFLASSSGVTSSFCKATAMKPLFASRADDELLDYGADQ